jgi:hypothetical protein
MGRKKLYSKAVPIILRLEGELLHLVDDSAQKQDLSRNALLTTLIARDFNQLGLAHKESMHSPPNTDGTILQGMITSEQNNRKSSARARRENRELRMKVIAGYGNRCACCGETRFKFLNVDHVNGADGRRGSYLLRYIIRHNFPPQYRVLCFNCNLGRKTNNGVCPHSA